MTNDLKLAPTEDLIVELLNRFDHAVFSGMRVNIDGQGSHETQRKWIGNSATCAGLCSGLSFRINEVLLDESYEEDNER